MKGHKIIFLVGILCAMLVCFAGIASADVDVASARIDKIGAHSSFADRPPIFLTDLSAKAWTGSRMFYLSPTLGNQGLATALTALSMGQSVWVRVSGTGVAGSLVTVLYVTGQ